MKFTANHYANVQGWPKELVEEAAQVMSEQTGYSIHEEHDALDVSCSHRYLRLYKTADGRLKVYVAHWDGNKEQLSREDVEKIIKHHKNSKDTSHTHITSAAHTLAKAGDNLQQALEWQQEANKRVEEAEKEYKDALEELTNTLVK